MNERIITANKKNTKYYLLLVLVISLHLSFVKLIFDNFTVILVAIVIVIILLGLHLTLGRKLNLKGGVTA